MSSTPSRAPAKKPYTPSVRGTPKAKRLSSSPATLMKKQSNGSLAQSGTGMLWVENPALLANSPAMKGRPFVNHISLDDSPAVRLTVDGSDSQQAISVWGDGDDTLSLDMLTDVDEVLDDDVSQSDAPLRP
jgi:hypothetical protein